MEINDRRTPEILKTHTVLITATDRFMSGWGHARSGLSKVAWACKPEHMDAVEKWVRDRKDMRYVNRTDAKGWRPRNCAHMSIYVVDDAHPALDKLPAPR